MGIELTGDKISSANAGALLDILVRGKLARVHFETLVFTIKIKHLMHQ
jgi:hypothetical protein